MEPIVIRDPNSGAEAKILAEFGFNCFSFQAPVDGELIEVLDAEPGFSADGGRASGNGIPILFPFPNRIREGRYRWNDQDFQLTELDGDGNAIHGFVLDRPWRVTASGTNFVVGEFQLSVDAPDRLPHWPADFILELRYEVAGSTLGCQITITNPSQDPLPWGFGTHAYFRMPLAGDSGATDCLVQAPAAESWELINCLPTGKKVPVDGHVDLRDGRRLGDRPLDDVLTGVEPQNGHIETLAMDEKAGLQISQKTDSIFRELVVYTPPTGRSVCLEPYTCVTDAINLEEAGHDTGWLVLPPGEKIQTWINIELGRVYA